MILDGSKKKYRDNLPCPEDTTMHGGPLQVTPGFLRFVGELLFGERWQTPLAHGLGEARGKTAFPRHGPSLEHGSRSIPDWVGNALLAILENGRRDFDRRARMAGALATRIRNPAPRERAALDWAEGARGRGPAGLARLTS